jgi:hypothetical protein
MMFPVTFSERRSLRLLLFLTALWSLLGAAACACYFAVSGLPAQSGDLPRSPLSLLGVFLGAVMLPACLVLPAVLLLAGRRHLRNAAAAATPVVHQGSAVRAAAGARPVTRWTATAQGSVLVGACFILRLYWHLRARADITGPSWHALEFSIAFLITGAAMAGVLISATRRQRQPARYAR